MRAILQLFMWYKISESYYVFNGEYHEYINNAQNQKKKDAETQIHVIEKLLKNWSFLFKKGVGILKRLKLEIF